LMATFLFQLLALAIAATMIVLMGNEVHAPNWLVYVVCALLGFGALLLFKKRD
jgi:hypothetical protein